MSIQINLKKENIDCQTENIKIKNVEVLECLTTQNNVDNNAQNRVENNNTNDLIEGLLIESQTSNTSTSNCSSIKGDSKIIENIIINKPTDMADPPVINGVKEDVSNTKLDSIGNPPIYASDQKISQNIEKLSSNKISVNLSQQSLYPEVQIMNENITKQEINNLPIEKETDEQPNTSKIENKENYPEDLDEQKSDYSKTVQSSYNNTDTTENNRIKRKSEFKNAVCTKNRARTTKALSWLQYFEDFPSQNKFMTIVLVILATLLLGHFLATYAMLFLILLYVNMANVRSLLRAISERRTDIIDKNKLETKLENKTIKSIAMIGESTRIKEQHKKINKNNSVFSKLSNRLIKTYPR